MSLQWHSTVSLVNFLSVCSFAIWSIIPDTHSLLKNKTRLLREANTGDTSFCWPLYYTPLSCSQSSLGKMRQVVFFKHAPFWLMRLMCWFFSPSSLFWSGKSELQAGQKAEKWDPSPLWPHENVQDLHLFTFFFFPRANKSSLMCLLCIGCGQDLSCSRI